MLAIYLKIVVLHNYTAQHIRFLTYITHLNLLNAIILNTYVKNIIIKDGSN